MNRFLTLLLMMFFAYSVLYGQSYNETDRFLKANSVWVFGKKTGLDLNTGSPIATAIESAEVSASVSDSTGRLLFYTGSNGTIWNRDHLPMQNGTGLIPFHSTLNNSSCAQGAVIVPFIDTPWKYYVFFSMQREGYEAAVSEPYLTYSVVDMSLNNGLGGVEAGGKNVPLYNHALHESMIAIPGNNCDIWLITISAYHPKVPVDPKLPKDTMNYFMAWHITERGIDTTPVLSPTHAAITKWYTSTSIYVSASSMAVSPGRNYISWAAQNSICLAKFDPETGKADSSISFSGSTIGNYSVCFSPDNTKLYCSNLGRGLYQYDISVFDSAAIKASAYRVYWREPGRGQIIAISYDGALKLYDGVIYVPYRLDGKFAKIKKPNKAGADCDFEADAIQIAGAVPSLPTDVVFPLTRYEYNETYDTICHVLEKGYRPTILEASAEFSHYEWNDGVLTANREITEPGTYWVRYYDFDCRIYVDTFHVHAVDIVTPDVTVDVFTLRTLSPYDSYQWLLNGAIISGATQREYTVSENGNYQVVVANNNGCSDTSAAYEITNVPLPNSISGTQSIENGISVYPNPVKDILNISASYPVEVNILSVDGRLLKVVRNSKKVDMSYLSPGLYLLQVKDGSGKLLKAGKITKVD